MVPVRSGNTRFSQNELVPVRSGNARSRRTNRGTGDSRRTNLGRDDRGTGDLTGRIWTGTNLGRDDRGTQDSRRTILGRDDRGTGISHAASGNGRMLCATWASSRFGRNFDPKSFPQEGGSGEPDPYLQRKPTRTLHRTAVREKYFL